MSHTEELDDVALQVLEGVEIHGSINTPTDQLVAHIRHAIRQGHPQVRPEELKADRIALVGGGPSLNDTLPELRELVFAGAKVVTVNGAYHWCLEHNIRVSAQIVLDAKPSTARFLDPVIPQCLYFVASQCHPDVWASVKDRERVFIWHSLSPDNPERDVLDQYYAKHWHGIAGGTTVASRAIALLRTIGYLRFDLFGIDCCWLGDAHHAFDQAENVSEKKIPLTVTPTRGDLPPKTFHCAAWHIKQAEDFLQLIRVNGEHFLLNVHGEGMLAYMLQAGAHVMKAETDGA